MYIADIHIDHFRHLKNVRLGPYEPPGDSSDLVVLAGPNGGGKSSVLELIGFALSNTWSLSWQLRRSFPDNAFEVALGITGKERELIFAYLDETKEQYSEEVRPYLEDNSIYYRAYNFTTGKYQENANLYNQIHRLCTNALRNHYKRSLGFFLKSERYYPPEGFRRDRLFEYQSMKQQDHVWNLAFNTSDVQYKDMFEFLVQQRYHYFRDLGKHHHLSNTGEPTEGKPPTDPLRPYDQLLRKLFPHYQFADKSEDVPSNLFVKIPTGEIVPFSDLSSGEKEVFFILSFFVRHNVESAVIVVDEPELHLHPELARLLVRTMQSVRKGNQVWLATHNTEIIDEAGRDRVTYIARDPKTFKSVTTAATEEDEALLKLKDMFGYSGYVGVSRRMVFLEGENSSADRKLFANLFSDLGGGIRFIPANCAENQVKLNAAILSILESEMGWVTFYLIRDRDYLSSDMVAKYGSHSSGRVCVLKRHEIENYLLDEVLISKVQGETFGEPTTPEQVRSRLHKIAIALSGEVLRDMIAFRLNAIYRPQDFSLGNFLVAQPIFDHDESAVKSRLTALQSRVEATVEDINTRLKELTSATHLSELRSECQTQIYEALQNDDGWKVLFPGKKLLEEYCKSEGLGKPVVLQNALIKQFTEQKDRIPGELLSIVRKIDKGESLL